MSPKGNTRKDNSLLIELKNITRSFGYGEAESFALNDFNLEVKPGEFIMIMGPSGCGKTTLLNILGLLDFPTSGSYYLDSERTTNFSKSHQAHIRAKQIGFIFQDFNLIPKMTILENVSLPLIYAGISKTKSLIHSSKILSYFNMQEREYYYPYQLSGGQKQRVAIARALVSSPEIILADEPTGNLDSRNAHLVMEELRRIHSKGNTIIMVTHNPNLTTYATRVIHMLDGRIDTDIKTVADEDLPERIKIRFNPKKSIPDSPIMDSDKTDSKTPETHYINHQDKNQIKIRPIKKVGSRSTIFNTTRHTTGVVEHTSNIESSKTIPKTAWLSSSDQEQKIIHKNTINISETKDLTSSNNSQSEFKNPNLSYKYPEDSEISVDNAPVSTFPVVSSSSSDNSVRIIKKIPSLEEIEKINAKKTKPKLKSTKNARQKQAKGRRK